MDNLSNETIIISKEQYRDHQRSKRSAAAAAKERKNELQRERRVVEKLNKQQQKESAVDQLADVREKNRNRQRKWRALKTGHEE